MQVSSVAQKVGNYINKSKGAQKVLTYFNDNAALANAGLAATLSIIARPLTMECLNFKSDNDRRYSQCSSIAAGITEVFSTFCIFYFLNKGINKAADNLYDIPKNIFYHNKEGLRQFKSITNRIFKVAALVPISFTRFALVKPLVNALFKKEKTAIQKYPKNQITFGEYSEKTKKGVNVWG